VITVGRLAKFAGVTITTAKAPTTAWGASG
jgi:hypothetical protein